MPWVTCKGICFSSYELCSSHMTFNPKHTPLVWKNLIGIASRYRIWLIILESSSSGPKCAKTWIIKNPSTPRETENKQQQCIEEDGTWLKIVCSYCERSDDAVWQITVWTGDNSALLTGLGEGLQHIWYTLRGDSSWAVSGEIPTSGEWCSVNHRICGTPMFS